MKKVMIWHMFLHMHALACMHVHGKGDAFLTFIFFVFVFAKSIHMLLRTQTNDVKKYLQTIGWVYTLQLFIIYIILFHKH